MDALTGKFRELYEEWAKATANLLTWERISDLLTALILLSVMLFIARRARRSIGRLSQLESNQRLLVERLASFTFTTLGFALALDQLGFDLKVLLGAAGVLTVAVGFAAQTSASNLISGFFLIFERPFVVGQSVDVGGLRGEVVAIDLLSTKIRTFNNLIVRIPNETLVKSQITNYSHYPIRRIELSVGVAYGSNLDLVESTIARVLDQHPRVLKNPPPRILMQGFGASSLDFMVYAWTATDLALDLPSELYRQIEEVFRLEKIEIPFPTRTLVVQHVGKDATAPSAAHHPQVLQHLIDE
jgi:small-conductance mechanosensitive channel